MVALLPNRQAISAGTLGVSSRRKEVVSSCRGAVPATILNFSVFLF